MVTTVYSTLDRNSDIYAYHTKEFNTYSMIVSYFNADGEEHLLKYAGTSIHVKSLKELRNKLFELRQLGYIVNDSAFEKIDKELNNGV